MKKESKDILWVVVIGFAVMFALPAAYRVWIHFNPPPQRKPISVVLHEAGGVRREALLATPTDKWTDADKKLAPDVHEWLTAHADVILPWEMSEEARKKDWKGYCNSWRRIVDELSDRLEKFAARRAEDVKDAADAQSAEAAKADAAELSGARGGLADVVAEIAVAEKRGFATGGLSKNATRQLLESIAVAYKHRSAGKRRLPKWLPNRVRNWLSMNVGGSSYPLGAA